MSLLPAEIVTPNGLAGVLQIVGKACKFDIPACAP